jgi:hypothetical protein
VRKDLKLVLTIFRLTSGEKERGPRDDFVLTVIIYGNCSLTKDLMPKGISKTLQCIVKKWLVE